MPVSISLNSPDASFRLDTQERANIADIYDPDALEHLLAHVRPEQRTEILAHFQVEPADGRRRGYLTEILDPKLQPFLDAVWAPLWRNASDQEIDANIYGLPGRLAEKKRRENRGSDHRNSPH
jgi:hypothetical protein